MEVEFFITEFPFKFTRKGNCLENQRDHIKVWLSHILLGPVTLYDIFFMPLKRLEI